jgi:glutathione S-transferase
MRERDPVLHMFPASHFNEKVRWALDWKGIPHRRVSYLPGPHARPIQRLSGQRQTPVLVTSGRVVAGSAQILDELERAHPAPALYPEDPALREHALSLQRHFDDEVGPAVRTAVFSMLILEPDYLCAIFTRTQSRAKRVLYRAAFPLARSLVARGNGVDDPENVARALALTEAALDETAKRVGASGQLVGGSFTVADLTAAALLAPLADVAHPDMARPQPVPERAAEFYARFEGRPALQWVSEQYAKHRPLPLGW